MQQGDSEKALNVLKPRLNGDQVDPELLTLAGEIFLLRGEPGKAEAALKTATQRAPESIQSRLSLAVARMALGQERGLNDLQDLAVQDGNRSAALILINSRMQARQFDKALEAITELAAKDPTSVLPYQLRGQLELSRRNLSAARQAYEAVLQRDADNFQSIAALAAIDIAESGSTVKALARFQSLLERKPRHAKAKVAVLKLQAASGVQGGALSKLIADAVRAIPDSSELRLQQIRHLLDQRDLKGALTAAQEAAAALPNRGEILDALGQAQRANGELQQATATFSKWAALQPQSVTAQMRLAELHVASKNLDAATEHLRKALSLQPLHLEAQRAMVGLLLSKRNFEAALGMAREMQGRKTQRTLGLVIEGDIEAYRNQWSAARKAYSTALSLEPNAASVAIKVHESHLAAGDQAGAAAFASQWLTKQPRNLEFLRHLGDMAAASGQYAPAEAYYAKAYAVDPDDAVIANNLAWLRAKLRNPDALALAQQLNARHPGNPAYLNTLALAYAEAGDLQSALKTQKESLAHAQVPAARLQLAELLLRNGQRDDAKQELQKLATLNEKHPEKSQAVKLLSALK